MCEQYDIRGQQLAQLAVPSLSPSHVAYHRPSRCVGVSLSVADVPANVILICACLDPVTLTLTDVVDRVISSGDCDRVI